MAWLDVNDLDAIDRASRAQFAGEFARRSCNGRFTLDLAGIAGFIG